MPMQRERYPKNWPEIATAIKAAANWHCQACGRPCRQPGESLFAFIERIQGESHVDLDWANQTAIATICDKPQRFTLTVAHLDQNPSNNAAANLRALCVPCHLNYDRPFLPHNRHAKRESQGQQTIYQIGLIDPAPAGHGKAYRHPTAHAAPATVISYGTATGGRAILENLSTTMPKQLWQVGDRLRHRETGEFATVTEFNHSKFFISGHFARVHYDNPIKYSQVNGDWGCVRTDWDVVDIPPYNGPRADDPVVLWDPIDGSITDSQLRAICEAAQPKPDPK